MDDKFTIAEGGGSSNVAAAFNKPAAKPVVRGKGKALNAIAAASGRDPAAIVAAAAAARARMEEEEAAEEAARREKEKKEKSSKMELATNAAAAAGVGDDDEDDEDLGLSPSRIYNQLSEQDRYRFECFRRCGFPSRPMEQFIAKMLVEEAERRYIIRGGVRVGMGQDVCKIDASADKVMGSNEYGRIDGGAASIVTSDDASTTKSSNNSNNDATQNKRKMKQSMKRMLKDESKRRKIAMDQPFPYHHYGKTNAPPPKLEHLVVPSSASEIVAVVSTLAKYYAQRLVAAARRVADAEMEKDKEMHEIHASNSSLAEDTSKSTSVAAAAQTTEIQPLQPHHLLEAHLHRERAGLDPGFWMSSRIGQQQQHRGGRLGGNNSKGVGVMEAAALGTFDRDRACYMAALAAQDAYDREVVDNDSESKVDSVADCEMEVEENV